MNAGEARHQKAPAALFAWVALPASCTTVIVVKTVTPTINQHPAAHLVGLFSVARPRRPRRLSVVVYAACCWGSCRNMVGSRVGSWHERRRCESCAACSLVPRLACNPSQLSPTKQAFKQSSHHPLEGRRMVIRMPPLLAMQNLSKQSTTGPSQPLASRGQADGDPRAAPVRRSRAAAAAAPPRRHIVRLEEVG